MPPPQLASCDLNRLCFASAMVRLPKKSGSEILGDKAPQYLLGLALVFVLLLGLVIYALFVSVQTRGRIPKPHSDEAAQESEVSTR